MKHINTYITEYIIKKKLDEPIDSSKNGLINELINVCGITYDKYPKMSKTIKDWVNENNIIDVSYYFPRPVDIKRFKKEHGNKYNNKIVKDYNPEYNVESKSVWEHTDVLMYTNKNMIYDGKYMLVIVSK